MLRVFIPESSGWNESTEEFESSPSCHLSLEHSLVSISKWEAKWNKAFLGKQKKTDAEMVDYIRCMTLTQNVPDEVYKHLPADVVTQIRDYIYAPMTATYFPEEKGHAHSFDTPTSELIYYWMICFGIPFECQKWHLNRLMALIKVCEIKNSAANGGKKMSRNELLARNRELNAIRRKQLGSKG